MIGVVIIGHSKLPDELLKVAVHVVGPQENVETVCIEADDDIDEKHAELQKKIEKVRMPGGVVIVTDMFGGTPSNLAISFMKNDEVEILAGANIPMLIKLFLMRQGLPMRDTVQESLKAGVKYINLASELLKK